MHDLLKGTFNLTNGLTVVNDHENTFIMMTSPLTSAVHCVHC